ncbi:hypothetical protein N7449_009700 [Penicillium cf. viridicatum]|uniref:Uncharacterized protein n=1 Tax=Penicillium cf. viridicatum TaxID=2972119 RepID=A0A9W9JAL1_9EURO|nr:hypothetical protein N7449_009700 [Penicillium cf. viridicatum]
MEAKRPCQACWRSDHPLKDCPFRNFYDPGQGKASIAASGIPTTKTATTKATTKTPATSYAQMRLMAPTKRQRAHPLRSSEFQKPKSLPLATYSEMAGSNEDSVENTPITESISSKRH